MVLDDLYSLLADGKDIRNLHIPRSEIFYLKSAIEAKLGIDVDPYELEMIVLEEWEAGYITAPEPLIKELKRIYK